MKLWRLNELMNTESRSDIYQEELRVRLKAKYGAERVYVIPRDKVGLEQGFTKFDWGIFVDMLADGEFKDRWRAEFNPKYRQPIPYIMIERDGKLFGTKRLSGSGEERLVGQISLGAGGHINPCDTDNQNYLGVIGNAMVREFHEELDTAKIEDLDVPCMILGYISDESNEVGKDHIGIVFVVSLPTEIDDLKVKEVDKLEGAWYSVDELLGDITALETWSAIALGAYLKHKEDMKNEG